LAVAFASCTSKVKLPPLTETFSKTDKNPFGGFIARKQFENLYPRNYVREKRTAFDETWNEITDTSALYVCITPRLYVNEDDATAMLNYVAAGNTLFISASIFDSELLHRINCMQSQYSQSSFLGFDSVRTTDVKNEDANYDYFYLPFKSSFTYTDSVFTKPLGVNDEGKTNFILYFYGRGKLLLHADPRAFSNYFLLKNDNYKYMQQVLSYTSNNPDNIYWDDYYRKLNRRSAASKNKNNKDEDSFSTLRAILAHNELAWAFWLSVVALLLYILFSMKRRQRQIEIVKPNENTTVTFTETIGRLYLQKKDNKNIAEKAITYFNEYVRNTYFVNTNNTNSDFLSTLSRKSGLEKERVDKLYSTIQEVTNAVEVSDMQLLSLNLQIQQFIKK
jgi:hypothetical protein